MNISLHNLKADKALHKKTKRVGRGNASGHGSYSTRGVKGQKSRSGVSGLKRLGMRQQLLSIPKSRGFKSHFTKNQVVNLGQINKVFKDGQIVTPLALAKFGLVDKAKAGIKILAQGELTLKNLTFKDFQMSEAAKEAIIKAGGKIS
jgi:large subunit ribosomal protein L15